MIRKSLFFSYHKTRGDLCFLCEYRPPVLYPRLSSVVYMAPAKPLPLASIWSAYGLSSDPFFQAPLEPGIPTNQKRPVSLHVGRDKQIQDVVRRVVSSDSSRSLIHGAPGVGKTSFVSKLKSVLQENGVLSHSEPVRVQSGMTPRHFVAEILKVLLQVHANAGNQPGWIASVRANRADSREEKKFWESLRRKIVGENSAAIGLTLGFVGAQAEATRFSSEIPELSLIDDVKMALSFLSQEGRRRVLIHINNMESLSAGDAASAASLMLQVRDIFLCDYGHWLFVGTSDIENTIFRVHDQVDSIIPPGISLGTLTSEEVSELIELRYQHLRLGIRFVPPILPSDAGLLYSRYRGNLRKFLSLLGEAVSRSALGVSLSESDVVALMSKYRWSHSLLSRISPEDAKYLVSVFFGLPSFAEFPQPPAKLYSDYSKLR